MHWCFAKINGRLAEVYFEEEKGETFFYGHAYVKEEEFKTKKEKKWIKEGTTKYQLSYGKGCYKDKNGNIFKSKNFEIKEEDLITIDSLDELLKF